MRHCGPAWGTGRGRRLRRVTRRALALPVLLALVISGCGASDNGTAPEAAAPTSGAAPAASASFPAAKGKSIAALLQGMPRGLGLAPSVSVLHPGSSRVGFAVFDTARKPINGAPVALYISRQDGSQARGPFLARSESLVVKPAFRSLTASRDPDAAKMVYVAHVKFPKAGKYRMSGIAQLDGRMVALDPFVADVTDRGGGVPMVGARAPRVHTPTLASVGGDATKIDTRAPAAKDLLKDDLYDVYGKKPVVLLFATPSLCQSRVCGPVVDVQAEVRAAMGDKEVSFIHVEIYRDNQVNRGLRSQPAAYRIPTEPWLFVLDRAGRVSTRIEGAFSAEELERAIAKVTGAA